MINIILYMSKVSEFWKDRYMSLPRPLKFDLDEKDSTKTCAFNPSENDWIKLFVISTCDEGSNTINIEWRSVLPFLIKKVFLYLLLLKLIALVVAWYTIGIISKVIIYIYENLT